MLKKVTIFMITLFALLSGTASAQEFAVKSNLLYDATSTINLGVEYGLSPRWTLEVSGNYNAWTFSDNKKMKLWMLQPGVRYWTCSRFAGHFWEAHLLGGEYNYGGMLPFGIKPPRRDWAVSAIRAGWREQEWATGTVGCWASAGIWKLPSDWAMCISATTVSSARRAATSWAVGIRTTSALLRLPFPLSIL